MSTFHQYKASASPRVRKGLASTICTALEVHAQASRKRSSTRRCARSTEVSSIRESMAEHQEMKRLIGLLRPGWNQEAIDYDETVMALMREVLHHVADEETVVLPAAERLLGDSLGELGARHDQAPCAACRAAQRRDRTRHGPRGLGQYGGTLDRRARGAGPVMGQPIRTRAAPPAAPHDLPPVTDRGAAVAIGQRIAASAPARPAVPCGAGLQSPSSWRASSSSPIRPSKDWRAATCASRAR